MSTVKFFLIWAIFFYLICQNAAATNSSSSLPKFSALFIFGDSILDTGNNNYIKTWIKANYLPYGQDYVGHVPTGRFSNGKLIPDLLASMLRIKEAVPPFLDPKLSQEDLITGVNFASGGSGYDDSTILLSNVIPISKQIELFKNYIEKLKGVVGEVKAVEIINDALVIISGGTNDFLLNFYDIPTRRLQFQKNISEYQDFLLDKVQGFTKELYTLGCRQFAVLSLPPIGVLPIQMTVARLVAKSTLEDQNRDSQVYNQKLVKLLTKTQATLPGSKIVYGDLYDTVMDMITHPQKYGFSETKKGCCGSGLFETFLLCKPLTAPCKDPSKFLFWDMIHPTSMAYKYYFTKYFVEIVLPKFL